MVQVYDWPSGLRVRSPGFQPRGMTVQGPVSLTGGSQSHSVDSGYWIATLAFIPAVTPTAVRVFRALRALLEGGANHIRVPVKDGANAPWPLDGNGRPITSAAAAVFDDDDATFDDGSGFAQPVIAAVLAEDAALRATSVTIDFVNAGTIMGGEYFSIGDRLHVIKAVLAESGTEKTVAIWPPLREAAPAGRDVEFDAPKCRMRLADDAASDLTLDLGRFGFPDLSFVEAF